MIRDAAHLEEAKLVRGFVWPHNESPDMANILVPASDGNGFRHRQRQLDGARCKLLKAGKRTEVGASLYFVELLCEDEVSALGAEADERPVRCSPCGGAQPW